MNYIDYSSSQIEEIAYELNNKYDADRLVKPKSVDVYDIVDLLRARIAFEFLSPDRTYFGATLFQASSLYVWPGNPYVDGMQPILKIFYEGTIIIDRSLIESKLEQDRFIENYTVMHECFHFYKQREAFECPGHMSKSFSEYAKAKMDKKSALYKIGRQADFFAAAFLMPRGAVMTAAKENLGYKGKRLEFGYAIKPKIKEMGKLFGVNYSPMCYRLQEMGILDYDFNPHI